MLRLSVKPQYKDFSIDEPQCKKEELFISNGTFASKCGRRTSQEDRVCGKTFMSPLGTVHCVSVLDGHGGEVAADFVREHLCNIIETRMQELTKIEECKEALENAFVDCHRLLKTKHPFTDSGVCVICCLTIGEHYVFATVGDCRALAIHKDGKFEIITPEHKASDPLEMERVQNAGLSVIYDRVGGSLAISRAIGDFEFVGKHGAYHEKTHAITCFPDVLIYPKSELIQTIVLMSDGIYESLEMKTISEIVLTKKMENVELCSFIVDLAIQEGSSDNVTCLLVSCS